jgi:hypothetical protein
MNTKNKRVVAKNAALAEKLLDRNAFYYAVRDFVLQTETQ